MKKEMLLVTALILFSAGVWAQDISSIISDGISKVIRATDLVIQRKQTQTIVLQEAQQVVQNLMSELALDDIRDWVDRQRELYSGYFQELNQVKDVIAGYHRVKEAIQRQETIVDAYQQGLARFRQDPHFSAAELVQIEIVFQGILTDSEKNLGEVSKMIGPGIFQMTDQQRLAGLDDASGGIDRNSLKLRAFTEQNELLSLQRAKDENDYLTILNLYGL
jgi:hypothetical protein